MPKITHKARFGGQRDYPLMETELIMYDGGIAGAYMLAIEYQRIGGHFSINGARMYNLQDRYVGWWAVYSMPVPLVHEWIDMIQGDLLVTRPVFPFHSGKEETLYSK